MLRASSRRFAVIEGLESRTLLSTIVVTSTLDTIAGPMTLRKAVVVANHSADPATITFDPTVFATPQTITLTRPLPLELSNAAFATTITGPAAGVTINVNGLQLNAFTVDQGVTASFSKLTISKSGSSAIANAGTLHLTTVTLSNNTGLGIANSGTLTVANSLIVGNQSGGLSNGSGTVTVTNTTFTANSGGFGGAVENMGNGKTALVNVTISNNTTSKLAGFAGGIFNDNENGSVSLSNCIISGNTDGARGDVYGKFVSFGHNLIGKTDGSTGWNVADFTGTIAHPLDAKLSVLGNYGGPTQTMRPLFGSAAIDHGSNSLVPAGATTDQRGLARVVNGTVDIGAVEIGALEEAASISGNVFKDVNANGKRDTAEQGFAGATVYLDANQNGKLDVGERSLTTDASGNFKFVGLTAGTWRVREVIPAGQLLTTPTTGYFDVTLKAGQAAVGYAFGDAQATGSISGRVFNDANGNGLRDPGELGLGLWQVFIDYNNDGKIDGSDVTATTDASGNWSFTKLATGTYTIRVVPMNGAAATKPTGGVLTIKLAAGQVSSGNLFGEKATS